MTYELDDAEGRHARFPDSFSIPSEEDREGLQPGDWAKLIFSYIDHSGTERMWVKITEARTVKNNRRVYTGVLDNDPVYAGLKLGEVVAFGPHHIVGIIHGREEEE